MCFKNLFVLVTFITVKIFVKYLRKMRMQVAWVSAPYRLQEHLHNGLKHEDGLSPLLFILQYAIRNVVPIGWEGLKLNGTQQPLVSATQSYSFDGQKCKYCKEKHKLCYLIERMFV
jgi:hypothetical protein